MTAGAGTGNRIDVGGVMHTRPMLITLATDFGTADPYVAQMKGVLCRLAPGATILDLTHDLPPFAVDRGALFVRGLRDWFPPRTVHVVIVDPGVGTDRPGVVVATQEQYFVGPDNGLFHFLRDDDAASVWVLPCAAAHAAPTFHGRDLFAPWAARIVADAAVLQHLERRSPAQLTPWAWPDPVRDDGVRIEATVIGIDRFGNCVTNVPAGWLQHPSTPGFWRVAAVAAAPATWVIEGLAQTYAEGGPGRPLALIGSHGFLEVAWREASAAERLQIRTGDRIAVQWENRT